MMDDRIYFSGTIGEALRNPQSKASKAFFNGARAVMTALELMSSSECRQALSVKNQQHIIALLVRSEEQQQERRRNDMEALLKIYWVDKAKARGFIFDVPAIDDLSGVATDMYGNHIENENFQLLPECQTSYWPNCKIENDMDNTVITREEYLALDEDKRSNYSYIRYFMLETADKKPAMQISSIDRYAMEALIRQDILLGDPEVIKRYKYAIASDDSRFRELKKYSDVITLAVREVGCDTYPIAYSSREEGKITTDK